MSEIDYNDPKFKAAAFILAEKTPRHLNVPTTPPIHWRLEGEILRVLLADGRTVRAPLADQVAPKPAPVEKVALPKKDPVPPAPVVVPPVPKTPPETPGRPK